MLSLLLLLSRYGVRSRRFVSWAELLLSPAATAEIVTGACRHQRRYQPCRPHRAVGIVDAAAVHPVETVDTHTYRCRDRHPHLSPPGATPGRSSMLLSPAVLPPESTSSRSPLARLSISPEPLCRRCRCPRHRDHHFILVVSLRQLAVHTVARHTALVGVAHLLVSHSEDSQLLPRCHHFGAESY